MEDTVPHDDLPNVTTFVLINGNHTRKKMKIYVLVRYKLFLLKND